MDVRSVFAASNGAWTTEAQRDERLIRFAVQGKRNLLETGSKMRERSIATIWLGGIALALLIYTIGPDTFVWSIQSFLDNVGPAVANLLARLTMMSFDLVRALAIALFAVFLVLSVVALRRGVPVRLLMVCIVVGFLALVQRSGFVGYSDYYSHKSWLGAFAVAAFGAVLMTRRLLDRPPSGGTYQQADLPQPGVVWRPERSDKP